LSPEKETYKRDIQIQKETYKGDKQMRKETYKTTHKQNELLILSRILLLLQLPLKRPVKETYISSERDQ